MIGSEWGRFALLFALLFCSFVRSSARGPVHVSVLLLLSVASFAELLGVPLVGIIP